MWLKRLSRRSQEAKEAGNLERKTIVPEDLLARSSWPFRRHSAPPQETRRAEEASLASTRESSFAEAAETFNPADHFSHLPEPLQERILQELGVKDLLVGAGSVNRAWRRVVLREAVWQERLQDGLPEVLLRHLGRRGPHSLRAAAFALFNDNLLGSPDFSPGGVSVDAGVPTMVPSLIRGKGKNGNRGVWRVQIGCCQHERVQVECRRQVLCSCGGMLSADRLHTLILTTPKWAAPEAKQEVNLWDALIARGMRPQEALDFLDTSPPLAFSVWYRVDPEQPNAWLKGFASVVLDDGRQSGTVHKSGWQGVRFGSQLQCGNAAAYWISWAPCATLLRGCNLQDNRFLTTPQGDFVCFSTIFSGYRPASLTGVRRATILLKGLRPENVYAGGKLSAGGPKPNAEFLAPWLHFVLPQADPTNTLYGETPDGERAAVKQMTESDMLDQTLIL